MNQWNDVRDLDTRIFIKTNLNPLFKIFGQPYTRELIDYSGNRDIFFLSNSFPHKLEVTSLKSRSKF